MAEILKKTRKILLFNNLSPGDVVAMTAAVRDLHRAHPGEFVIGVHSSAGEIWDNNPYITKLPIKLEPLGDQTEAGSKHEVLIKRAKVKIVLDDPEIEVFDCEYSGDYPASINRCNTNAFHFIHGYAHDIGRKLGVKIPITEYNGDIHISEQERGWMSQIEERGIRSNFWVVLGGGKFDFTAKWWDPAQYQKVIDHFLERILFVQCGEVSHHHPRLKNVIDLVGKTDIRQFIRLIYHADGVLCPVTFAMHLAAAVPMRPFDNYGRRKPPQRACVVLAGGREPTHWEAYPFHQYIHSTASLPCCRDGGCWKSRCQKVNDNDPKDENLCDSRIKVAPDLFIPKCQTMIRAETVIGRIKLYYSGGLFQYNEVNDYSKPVVERRERPQPDRHCLRYLIEHFCPTSLLDVGCDRGGIISAALEQGIDAYGLGQGTRILFTDDVRVPKSRLSVFDLSLDHWKSPHQFDLVWSARPDELAGPEMCANFITTIRENLCSEGVLFLTRDSTWRVPAAAEPDDEWISRWTARISEQGFQLLETESLNVRAVATDEQFKRCALIFKKTSFPLVTI